MTAVARVLFAAVVTAVLASLILSFRAPARFHAPSDDHAVRLRCIYQSIYMSPTGADVLVFGTSRTGAALLPKQLASELAGGSVPEPLVGRMYFAGNNTSLSYQFLLEYLAQHKAPGLILFEAQSLRESGNGAAPVPYVNRYFSTAALPWLYADLLLSIEDPPPVQRAGDVARIFIDHVDKVWTRILSPEYELNLRPDRINCMRGRDRGRQGAARERTVQEKRVQAQSRERRARMREAALDVVREKRGERWREMKNEDWVFGGDDGMRHAVYYRRIVALARAHGIRILFYHLPAYLEPPATGAQLAEFRHLAGAPVVTPDLELLEVIYRNYRDPNHVASKSRPPLMRWLAQSVHAEFGR